MRTFLHIAVVPVSVFEKAINGKEQMTALGCGFNRSMQHLISNDREEDVENEAATKDLLHRRTKGVDVGSLEER